MRLVAELGSRTSYEAHYLALAQREDCEFWTGNKGFWEAAKEAYPRVRWVGEGLDSPAVEEDSRE
ncbi:MAG: hypothetical protein M3R38_06340 [Actinomycetota bacterium]|nr:hypothetical protein [Actinomycetota bacterium]